MLNSRDHARPSASPAAVTERVLSLVESVARDLKPERSTGPIGLDTSLDRDLGLDSLARVELASRLEAAFEISLAETAFAASESPRDLANAVLAAQGRQGSAELERGVEALPAGGAGAAAPPSAHTLGAALAWHAGCHGERVHLRVYADEGDGEVLTYGALLSEARAVAAGLQASDVGPGETVAIMLPTDRAYFVAFCAVVLAGAIAVPIYPPLRATRLEEHVRRHVGILDNAQAHVLIVPPQAKPLARVLQAQVASLRRVTTVEELASAQGVLQPPVIAADDVALLQYTSGSTGNPKGVTLSHANLLANIRAMANALAVSPEDVFVSWLPLYHDMGLIGAWLGSLHQGTPLVIFSPLAFLARPARWLDAIHRYRGTISGAPNFAYELCLRHVGGEHLKKLDLSSWRVAFNGAEPVSASTVERFCERFASAGFRREAMAPVYGLAENCVGLAFPPLGRGPVIDHIRRDDLARRGRAVPAEPDVSSPLRLVACGRPLPDNDIRIVDAAGHELPERHEGRLQFRGPSATRGYWRNPEATRRLLDGEWRDSGDLGYVADGDLYITSRAKDLIIRAGRNIHPADVEASVSAVDGVLRGRVAAFGDVDATTGTERLVVLAETRRREPAALDRMRGEISGVVADLVGGPPDEVVLAPPNTIPRTSSGKIRRLASRDLWRDGRIGKTVAAPWLQGLRLAAATLGARLLLAGRAASGLLFAGWCWALLAAVAPFGWIAAVALPRFSWRWHALRASARLLFRATGTPLRVSGTDHLTDAPRVLVANHASYVDVVALVAALPRPVAFVAKAELRDSWLTRLPLDRIGTCFVERFDHRKGLEDYRRIAAIAREGRSPLFFPEGTFRRAPGLMPLRMGAFACAAEASLPVLPVVLRGTRAILPSGSWFPRPGAINVTIAPPIFPEQTAEHWASAVTLRDRVRATMLRLTGEPDMRDLEPFAGGAPQAEAARAR
jgi:1-acyl-sn-glycerol-3-phosphate acyltransferase